MMQCHSTSTTEQGEPETLTPSLRDPELKVVMTLKEEEFTALVIYLLLFRGVSFGLLILEGAGRGSNKIFAIFL